jgi:hypothetical protein
MNEPILRTRVNLDLLNDRASEATLSDAKGQMRAWQTRPQAIPLIGPDIPVGEKPVRIASEQT